MAESLKRKAREVAEAGRYGDEHLLHISGDELRLLLDTGRITRNPETGAYEAFSFGSFLSDIAKPVEHAVSSLGNVAQTGFNKFLNPFSSENVFKKGPLAALFPTQNPDVQKGSALAGGALLGGEALGLTGVPAAATTTGAEAFPVSAPAAIESTALGAPLSAAPGAADLGGLSDAELADILAGGSGSGSTLAGTTADVAGTTEGGATATKGGVLDFLAKNKGLLIPAGVLGLEMANKPKLPQVPNLQNIADQLQGGPTTQSASEAATSLIPSLSTGKLPPGAESMVSNAVQDAVGSIKAKYAQLGMSGSTAEAQEIAAAQSRGESMRFSFAEQATNTGLQAAGLVSAQNTSAAQIYALIMNAQLQSDQGLQNALSNFAFASALGSGLGKS